MGQIISSNTIITESDTYNAIVGNNWLEKTHAEISYEIKFMTIHWKEKEIHVSDEHRTLSCQHIEETRKENEKSEVNKTDEEYEIEEEE